MSFLFSDSSEHDYYSDYIKEYNKCVSALEVAKEALSKFVTNKQDASGIQEQLELVVKILEGVDK